MTPLFADNFQSVIGHLNLAMPKEFIHFAAVSNSKKDNVFVYETVLLNIGGGLDLVNGRFTTPKAGVYR